MRFFWKWKAWNPSDRTSNSSTAAAALPLPEKFNLQTQGPWRVRIRVACFIVWIHFHSLQLNKQGLDGKDRAPAIIELKCSKSVPWPWSYPLLAHVNVFRTRKCMLVMSKLLPWQTKGCQTTLTVALIWSHLLKLLILHWFFSVCVVAFDAQRPFFVDNPCGSPAEKRSLPEICRCLEILKNNVDAGICRCRVGRFESFA